MLYPAKIQTIVHVTPEELSVTEILSASTVKRLLVEQDRFLKRLITSQELLISTKLEITSFYIRFITKKKERPIIVKFNEHC